MEFRNVKLIGKANVFFGGKVSSRTFYEANGQRKTLGFMPAGEYEFSTSTIEDMEIIAGEFELKLPGEETFKKYVAGETFTIPCGIVFTARTDTYADYCCTFIEK